MVGSKAHSRAPMFVRESKNKAKGSIGEQEQKKSS
jgi:hypothetical protein